MPKTTRIWSFSPSRAAGPAQPHSPTACWRHLRRTEVVASRGTTRLIDDVDVITSVSGGSFPLRSLTACTVTSFLDQYEEALPEAQRAGASISIARLLNPTKWGALSSPGWGRSELRGPGLRRHPVPRRDVCRPRPRPRSIDRRHGNRHFDMDSRLIFDQAFFDIILLRTSIPCSLCRAPLPRRHPCR